jgi:hypothetical protein
MVVVLPRNDPSPNLATFRGRAIRWHGRFSVPIPQPRTLRIRMNAQPGRLLFRDNNARRGW